MQAAAARAAPAGTAPGGRPGCPPNWGRAPADVQVKRVSMKTLSSYVRRTQPGRSVGHPAARRVSSEARMPKAEVQPDHALVPIVVPGEFDSYFQRLAH